MDKNPLTKKELVARLKEIAADKTPRETYMGAMCYSTMGPPPKHVKCDMCGKDICYRDWYDHETILDLTGEMQSLGYDVKVEVICKSCAKKTKAELYPDMVDLDDEDIDLDKDIWLFDINHLFFFRAPDDTEYHRAIANPTDQYRSLLALMKNKRMYRDSYDGSHYIDEEKDIIEFMTGIKFEF